MSDLKFITERERLCYIKGATRSQSSIIKLKEKNELLISFVGELLKESAIHEVHQKIIRFEQEIIEGKRVYGDEDD